MEKMTRNSEALEHDLAMSLLFFLVSPRFCFDTGVAYINISLIVILNVLTLKHSIAQFKATPTTVKPLYLYFVII